MAKQDRAAQTVDTYIRQMKKELYQKVKNENIKLSPKFCRCQEEKDRTEVRAKKNNQSIQRIQEAIQSKFGQTLTHPELLTIARFVSEKYDIRIDRDAIRRKNGLLSWCSENMTEFLEVLSKTTGIPETSEYSAT